MNLSPPFQIGDPLNDPEEEDFTEIFPDEGELHIEPVGGGLSGAKIYRVTSLKSQNQYIVRYSSGIFGP